jgi:AcrR family transcriptional regulator
MITSGDRRQQAGRRGSRHRGVEARGDLRFTLLEAASRILRRDGAAGLTTREIAREAGCSDGALYVHFADKAQLLAAVCERWLPDLRAVLGDLVNRVGAATVTENLEAIALGALKSFADMAPLSFAIGGDPDLLTHHRTALRARGLGPRRGVEAVGGYLAAEQRVGRVRADAACDVVASTLIGSCWYRAAMRHYLGEDLLEVDDATYAAQLAATLGAALEPESTRTRRQPPGGRG